MKAGERYFMAAVALLTAKERIERILKSLEEEKLPPSMELMEACISNIVHAMTATHRERLSDDRFRIIPACRVRGCHDNGTLPVCPDHTPTVKCNDLKCDECYGWGEPGSVHK